MKKLKLKKIGFNWFENLYFNRGLNIIAYLVFVLVFVVMTKVIFRQFFPVPPPETQLILRHDSVLLIEYMGLPFAFYFFISLGLMFGLAFHDFKLFSINVRKGEYDHKHFKNKNHLRRKHT